MYKAQFKSKSPFNAWQSVGQYGTESAAISAALTAKNRGAIMVRVLDKQGKVVYTG